MGWSTLSAYRTRCISGKIGRTEKAATRDYALDVFICFTGFILPQPRKPRNHPVNLDAQPQLQEITKSTLNSAQSLLLPSSPKVP